MFNCECEHYEFEKVNPARNIQHLHYYVINNLTLQRLVIQFQFFFFFF